MSPVCSSSGTGTVWAEAGAAAASASTDAPSARITFLFITMFLPEALAGPFSPGAGFVRQLYASCPTIPLRPIGVKRRRCAKEARGGSMLDSVSTPAAGGTGLEAGGIEHFDVLFVGAGLS